MNSNCAATTATTDVRTEDVPSAPRQINDVMRKSDIKELDDGEPIIVERFKMLST